MFGDECAYEFDLLEFAVGVLLFWGAEDDPHAVISWVIEAVDEIGLSAADEIEAFEGCTESGRDIQCIGE